MLLLAACSPASPTATPSPSPDHADRLVAAWVDEGNLMLWRSGDSLARRVASGGVVRPYISPDGATIAYTRGPSGIAAALWSVDINGTAEREWVAPGDIPGGFQIGDVQWLDSDTILFNTLEPAVPVARTRDDLWRIDLISRGLSNLLPAGEGGAFRISPDGSAIAVLAAGRYGESPAHLRLFDLADLLADQNQVRAELNFDAIATGGHSAYYPRLHWLPDSQALLLAVADADLLYAESALLDPAQTNPDPLPQTRLWRISRDGAAVQYASLSASLFGQPRWSEDGRYLASMQREGDGSFVLSVAQADGSAAQRVSSAPAGQISHAAWIPDSDQFIYAQGEDEAYYLSSPLAQPLRLTEEVAFAPRFISDRAFVFVTPAALAADGWQLRIARLGSPSQEISPVGGSIPVYDARIWPRQP